MFSWRRWVPIALRYKSLRFKNRPSRTLFLFSTVLYPYWQYFIGIWRYFRRRLEFMLMANWFVRYNRPKVYFPHFSRMKAFIAMLSVRWCGTADVANPRPREVGGACRRQVLAGARTQETVGGPNGAQRSELRRTVPLDNNYIITGKCSPDMSWISVFGNATCQPSEFYNHPAGTNSSIRDDATVTSVTHW